MAEGGQVRSLKLDEVPGVHLPRQYEPAQGVPGDEPAPPHVDVDGFRRVDDVTGYDGEVVHVTAVHAHVHARLSRSFWTVVGICVVGVGGVLW